ncbi:MAG: hypothetical protein ABSF77_02695 [Spirochaetia bacterium]
MRRVIGYMDVFYGIDNPLFLEPRKDPHDIIRTMLPWLLRYILTMPKVRKLLLPVDEHLAKLSGSQALIDIIDQHFFKKTPAHFALSYFGLYLDYRYPRGGIVGVAPGRRTHLDARGRECSWRKLVWAADQKTFYRILDAGSIPNGKVRRSAEERQAALLDKRGGDSVFTLYLALDIDKSCFSERATAHLFCTTYTIGLSALDLRELTGDDPAKGGYTQDKARLI